MKRNKTISTRTIIRSMGFACIFLTVLTSTQCKRGDQVAPEKSKLPILVEGDEWIMWPGWDSDPKFLVLLPLFSPDKNTGLPDGRLAQRRKFSEGGRELTICLRKDVRWQDGVPVTAHDIKFTYELWTHPDVQHYMLERIESITILDDFTLKLRLKKRYLELLDTWGVFYAKHLVEDLDPKKFFEWEFWTKPIGNGPYRYVSHVLKTIMEFEANPDYYLGKPKIERVLIKSTGRTPLTELLSGNIDIARVEPQDVHTVSKDRRFRVYYTWGARRTQIFWNHKHPLFHDSSIRRALTLAIDRRTLHKVLDFPDDLPLTDGFYNWFQFSRGKYGKVLPYDPEMAKRLLDEAGWQDRDGDGIRERDGESFRFTVLTSGYLAQTAVFIQDQFRRVGVKMEVQTLNSSVVRIRLRARDYEAIIFVMGSKGLEFSVRIMFSDTTIPELSDL